MPAPDPASRPVAFITGASVGIGKAVALRLAALGYDLALAGLSSGSVDQTAAEAAALGAATTKHAFDVADTGAGKAAIADALARFGRVDALVNNAAVPLLRAAIDLDEAEWDAIMTPNLKGAFFLSQAMARHLRDAGRPGSIVNIASTHGIVALKDRSTYGIAKAGMIHMTRCLAVEWAEFGIRVNCVAPATISTPSREASLAEPAKRAFMIGRIPLGRFGTAEEVAGAVAYLTSPDSGFTTGHTLVLDGGLTAI